MEIKQRYNCWLPKILGVKAITLYPFIFYRDTPTSLTVSHELIHVEQIEKLGWLYFYITYLWQYTKGRFQGLNHKEAYLNISYEKEAYKRAK